MLGRFFVSRADIDVVTGWTGTVLATASFGGHLDIVKLLVANGTDANTADGRYESAYNAATKNVKLNVSAYLHSQGAKEPDTTRDSSL